MRDAKCNPGRETFDAAVWHMVNKLDDRGSVGFHRKVIGAVLAGDCTPARVNLAFVRAVDSGLSNRGGYFVKLLGPLPWRRQ